MKKQILTVSLISVLGLSANAQTILGIDVSSYQGNPNWTSVKSDPNKYQFAYAKATESTSIADASFASNMTNGMAAGLKMGAYHFCNPIANSASSEATYFLSKAKNYCTNCNMPPMLDVEDSPGESALSTMGGAALTTWVVAWCTAVQNATGIAPIIYTSGSYAKLMQSAATKYGLWIATVSNNPATPPSTTGSWSTWVLNQYSWTGSVSGISGSVDQDVFNGNQAAFNALVPCNPVVPAFTSNITTGCPGMTVNFTDKSTSTGTVNAWRWEFQGGTPSSSKVQNPSGIVYSTPGTYYVKEVVNSTTGHDSVTVNSYIHVISTGTLPLSETFQASTFPPSGWLLNYPSAGDSAWQLCTLTGYSSTQCMYFPANCGNSGNISGERQQIYTPDYSFAGVTNAGMTFDVAYEPSNLTSTPKYSDTLVVYYSTDCGNSWTQIYSKGGATLCTTGSTTGAGTDVVTMSRGSCFEPPSTSAWRKDSIGLSALNGLSNVMFSFENRSGWGNIIYLDNINITSASLTGMQNLVDNTDVKVYPNPNNGSFTMKIENGQMQNEQVRVAIYNLLGEQVYNETATFNSQLSINLGVKASGVYFYRIMNEGGDRLVSEGKVMVQH
jgi:GH25 family lysozyme M1 (1,4-beta-N-acetylmuramidase)